MHGQRPIDLLRPYEVKGQNRKEEVKAGNVKWVLPRFTPGKEFEQVLNNTELVKADN